MGQNSILSLGFEISNAHMPNGMDKRGYVHYKLDIPNSKRYLYLKDERGKYSIETIGGNDHNLKEVKSVKDIVDYIFEEAIKYGEHSFKTKINNLLS